MSTSDAPEISIARRNHVEVITLDRQDALNSLTPTMITKLVDSIRSAAADRSCRVIVITGAGERAFCAGIDVKSVAQRDEAARSDSSSIDPIVEQFENLHWKLSEIVRTIHKSATPVIGAINGHAIGAGFSIAAACDLRIASTSAKFADGFVARGLSGCEMGLSYFLPKIVGASAAFDWMLTGRRIEVDEALAAGLVGAVCEPADLVDRAVLVGDAIAANAPMATTMTKEVMWANLHAVSLDQALALEARTQFMTRNTADAAEARQAFIEKRPPVFSAATDPRPN